MLRALQRVSPSVVSEETVLPEPDSPTIPSVLPAKHLVGDPVDRVHDAVFGRELDAQVLDAQQRLAARGARDGGGSARSRVPDPRIEIRVGDVDDDVGDDDEHRRQQHRALDRLRKSAWTIAV